MSLLANSAVIGGEVNTGDIGHSLRFRASASAYLSRTFGTATNVKKWTWSGWVKIGKESGHSIYGQILFATGSGSSDSGTMTLYLDNGRIILSGYITLLLVTSNLERDPTGHVFVTVRFDSANATQNARANIYVNGVECTYATDNRSTLSAASDYGMNKAVLHTIGAWSWNSGSFAQPQYFDGYMSRICFVDGQALTPSSFGYLNTEINEWVSKTQSQVKAIVDAGGTNSFMLDFDNGTSLTTLGYDKSSKGNNWTLNNFSLAAGTTYDWMLDVPGNSFATLNPLIYDSLPNVPSSGNLTITLGNGTNGRLNWSTQGMRTGKWYAEFTVNTVSVNSHICGLIPVASTIITRNVGSTAVGSMAGEYGYGCISSSAYKGIGGTFSATGTTPPVAGSVIGLAFDADAGTMQITLNGVLQSIPGFTGIPAGEYFFAVAAVGYSWSTNFGQRPFAYTPPTGFKALCQANLPEVAIKNPTQHFQAKLDTGANIKTTSEAVFPSNFFEWIKDRANSNNHQLIDIVRGSSAVLQSNTTATETTYSAPSGLSVGWLWKAGGAPVTNNAGSITSQVSANVDAGFSIVTYTGTGANATVGHGLGVAPKLIITKTRGSAQDWAVWSGSLTATEAMFLNLTLAKQTGVSAWASTLPTSSVFSVGASNLTNQKSTSLVAYCFAEIEGYSKIGSYVGNGSADGPFVHCGFKPKFVLIKCSSAAGYNWRIFDAVRSPTNAVDNELNPNTATAEATGGAVVDFVSSGFKMRATEAGVNASGSTYIFIAFADVSGKYSLGR